MFEASLVILFLSPWLYFVGFGIYITIQYIDRKKLPGRLVIIDIICMAILLVVYVLVCTHRLAFVGEFIEPEIDRHDFTNIITAAINLICVIVVFFIFQFSFMAYFLKEVKKLRETDQLPHRQEGDVF